MNKLKHIAIAAAVAGAVLGGASAQAATTYDLGGALVSPFYSLGTSPTAAISAGTYTFNVLAGTQFLWSGASTIVADLYNGSTLVKELSVSYTGGSYGSYSSSQLSWTSALAAGTYHATYTITSPTGASTAVGQLQSVPGPIAGAGLPALLGLLGFAGYRRAKKNA